MAQSPALSCDSASTLFCCFVNTLLVEIGLDVTPGNVAACYPNKDILSALIDDEAAKTLAIIRQWMNDAKLFFSCDGANKNGLIMLLRFFFVELQSSNECIT